MREPPTKAEGTVKGHENDPPRLFNTLKKPSSSHVHSPRLPQKKKSIVKWIAVARPKMKQQSMMLAAKRKRVLQTLTPRFRRTFPP